MTTENPLFKKDLFVERHIGPRQGDVASMLGTLGLDDLGALVEAVVPSSIQMEKPLDLGPELSEHEGLRRLQEIASNNEIYRSYIGAGYYGTIMPATIQRNVLENPGWYTQYTPYQAEIAQGRLEALLNFQTMICDLTDLPLSNSSLLDEATAAAEAMVMCHVHGRRKRSKFFVSEDCHPQTLAVVETRALPIGIEVVVGSIDDAVERADSLFGAIFQYPDTYGRLVDPRKALAKLKEAGVQTVLAADLLALTLIESPGTLGADIAIGSTQRFGVPMMYGGPHAGYLAAASHLERLIPGRITGLSKDAAGRPALRLARQTREQHIRREKATSNICTAQVLPAVLASMYAVYHGPRGLQRIAARVHTSAQALCRTLSALGFQVDETPTFDSVNLDLGERAEEILGRTADARINLRRVDATRVSIALDETVEVEDLKLLVGVLAGDDSQPTDSTIVDHAEGAIPGDLDRSTPYLEDPVFHRYRSEHEMPRYLKRLQEKDLSLVHSMIPLGSCTMKLNAAVEMIPVSWPEFAQLHPFAPVEQAAGYRVLFEELNAWLAEITGLPAVSLQPNAGSQGELTGLLMIRGWHEGRGENERDVCLIPTSAHGTNPASAVMAGLRVVPVECDDEGNIDVADLRAKAEKHRDELSALMITYPSTHGVFEPTIREICDIVHENGGQIYMDGANMNAQVGLCRPGDVGADVCHLNLHKTFCIPHGGGGPGMGPVCGAEHLRPYLPSHPAEQVGEDAPALGPVAAAPFGSPGILPISWMYIYLMGSGGLRRASEIAILNANYMAKRIGEDYPVLYTGTNGFVAHEFIVDMRGFKTSAGVTVDDIAKRLMDYGFHAPTMSWPVAGTMMIEPTESESKEELDRFCDAMLSIREEIRALEEGKIDSEDNPLKNAPHTLEHVTSDSWTHPYSRQEAAYPRPWVRERKFWPPTTRVDNAFGDRNLICTCEPMSAYSADS